MKTSSKILIGFIVFIALSMLALAIDWRFFHNKGNRENNETDFTDVSMNDFKYMAVDHVPYVMIKTGPKTKMRFFPSQKINKLPVNFVIHGDTLFLSVKDASARFSGMELHCATIPQFVKANDTKIDFLGEEVPLLKVELDNTDFNDLRNDTIELKMDSLIISAVNKSDVNINHYLIKNLYISADHSDFNFNKQVENVFGELKRGSHINCRHFNNMSLKSEKGSRINMYD